MEMIPLPDIADMLGVSFSKVRQYVRDAKLLSMENEDGKRVVPDAFLRKTDGGYKLIDDVDGTAITLMDGGFTHDEACKWMISPCDLLDDELPIDVIRNGGYHKVNRVAGMIAF